MLKDKVTEEIKDVESQLYNLHVRLLILQAQSSALNYKEPNAKPEADNANSNTGSSKRSASVSSR